MRNVQRGGGIIDRAADQRLHRGIAAAGVDELHIEPMILEVAGRARDFVRHAAQKLAAIGELDLLALRFGAGGSRRRDDACDQRRALEQRAPRHVGIGYAGGGFVAAAHGSLQISLARCTPDARNPLGVMLPTYCCSLQRSSAERSRSDRAGLIERCCADDMPGSKQMSNA